MAKVGEDPRFRQGRVFLNEKKYEEAIGLFASLTQSCVEIYGEMSVESARAYYEYGNALLMQEEENPSKDLLGGVEEDGGEEDDGEENVQSKEKGGVQSNSGDNNAQEEEAGEEEQKPEAEEPAEQAEGEEAEGEEGEAQEEQADDLQVAWEVLDVSRCILEKQEDADRNLLLSDVYVRLADLLRLNDNCETSIAEYNKALAIRLKVCEPHDRQLSEIYFSLAVAHIYHSADKGVSSPLEEKKKALGYYAKAREVLKLSDGASLKPSSSSSDAADEGNAVTDIIEELSETIASLEEEIKEEEKSSSSSSSSASAAKGNLSNGVTTIGFGSGSTASSSAAVTSLKRNGADLTTTLQVKKKTKTSEPSHE